MSKQIMSNEKYKLYLERAAKRERQLKNLVLLAIATLEQLNPELQSTVGVDQLQQLDVCSLKNNSQQITELAYKPKARMIPKCSKKMFSQVSKVHLYQSENIIWEETTSQMQEISEMPFVAVNQLRQPEQTQLTFQQPSQNINLCLPYEGIEDRTTVELGLLQSEPSLSSVHKSSQDSRESIAQVDEVRSTHLMMDSIFFESCCKLSHTLYNKIFPNRKRWNKIV